MLIKNNNNNNFPSDSQTNMTSIGGICAEMNAKLLWMFDVGKAKPVDTIHAALSSVLSSSPLTGRLVSLADAAQFLSRTPRFLSPTTQQDARHRIQLAVVVDRIPVVVMTLNAYTVNKQSSSTTTTTTTSMQTRQRDNNDLTQSTTTATTSKTNNNTTSTSANNIDSLVLVGVVSLTQLSADVADIIDSKKKKTTMNASTEEGEQEFVVEAVKVEGAALAPLLASLSETQSAAVLTNAAARTFLLSAAGFILSLFFSNLFFVCCFDYRFILM